MAGGIFGRPFEMNIKCIIFSLIIISLFLYKPTFKNQISLYFTLFLLFIISYVVMAWYDFFFDCTTLPLKRGKISLTGLFKPTAPSTDNADCKYNNYLIYLSHILFLAPLLIYVAINGKKTSSVAFPILGAIAIMTLFYHGIRLTQLVH